MEEEDHAVTAKRSRKWFWLALPFATGLLVILAVLVSAMMNEWVLVTIDDKYPKYYSPSIAVDAEGDQHILAGHGEGTGLDRGISYLRAHDGDVDQSVLDESQFLVDGSILIDSAGNPHFLYTSYTPFVANPVQTLWYGAIENGSFKALIVDSSKTYHGFDLAVDSSNNPHVVYSDLTDIIYARLTEDGWQTQQNLSPYVLFTWPFEAGTYGFDVAIAVDSLDFPHVAAMVGWNVICCDLLANSSWRTTKWSAYDAMEDEIDIAADSKGNTHVVFPTSFPNSGSSSMGIYLGTLTGDGLWNFRPFIDPSRFGDDANFGHVELAVDENDGLVMCCSYGYPKKIFYQIGNTGSAVNGTIDDLEGFWSFDMGAGRDGRVYLVGQSSLQVLANSASLGERVDDLRYGWLLLAFAGISIIAGTVRVYRHWRTHERRQRN